MKTCACGCSEPVRGQGALYATAACRSRAWRKRTGYRVVGVREASQKRRAKPRRSARPRVDYLRALDAVSDALGADTARALLEPLLTDRGRAAAAEFRATPSP